MDKYGIENFSVQQIEECDVSQLDEREIYWIRYYDTYRQGYNATLGGTNDTFDDYLSVKVIENGLQIDSRERLARIISEYTDWSLCYLQKVIRIITDDPNKTFCNYHLVSIPRIYSEEESSEEEIKRWIESFKILYQGQHIYCEQLDKEFSTVGEAARYCIDNGFYTGKSKTPVQTVITSIGYNINGRNKKVECLGGLVFSKIPATTKQSGTKTPFKKKKIYCPQIDKEFNSMVEAARYFVENEIWTGIKEKTAKLRVGDVVRGIMPDYRGYTFEEVI